MSGSGAFIKALCSRGVAGPGGGALGAGGGGRATPPPAPCPAAGQKGA